MKPNWPTSISPLPVSSPKPCFRIYRNHPQQDAIHVAGWISLFTLHVLWPFLWIWATLYREDRGWGFHSPHPTTAEALAELKAELAAVSARLEAMEKPTGD